jgi:hypothetical protein
MTLDPDNLKTDSLTDRVDDLLHSAIEQDQITILKCENLSELVKNNVSSERCVKELAEIAEAAMDCSKRVWEARDLLKQI